MAPMPEKHSKLEQMLIKVLRYCKCRSLFFGIGASSTSSTSSTTTTTSGVAEEIGRLSFDIDDRYAFQLTDRDTGLSYRINPAATAATSASVVSLDRIILTDHGFKTGDAIISTTLAGIPGTNTVATPRYVIKIDEDTFQIAATAMQLLVALKH